MTLENVSDNIIPMPESRRRNRLEPARKQRFKIVPYTNRNGSHSWRVAGSKRDGERVRENFAEEAAARCRQIELETEYLRGHAETTVRATKLSAEQVQLAEVAFIKLGDDWLRLLDAVDQWKRTGQRNAIQDAPRVDDAVEQFLEWLKAQPFRDATKRNWKFRLGVFKNSVPNVRVSEITPDFIDDFLAKRNTSPGGKDTDRRAVSRFLSWCIERPRRWATTNACREVKIAKAEASAPSVLSVDDCQRLLAAAQKHKRGILAPYFAVCLFSGVRPFEASRLSWEQVNFADNEIRFEASQTKTGKPRVVTIKPVLRSWLKRYEGKPFFPANWRKEFEAVQLAAGFGRTDDRDPKRKHLKVWAPDVMRHTSISHFFRDSGSYGLAAEQFGNSEAIIKAHYQGRVSSADTKRFYGLKPAAVKNAS